MAQSSFLTRQFSSDQYVESCGAVLFDLSNSHEAEVCLVNFLKENIWLLAKGRRNIGESRKDAAIREVTEETGFKCHLLPLAIPTRACIPEEPSDALDKAKTVKDLTEPFMCTFRELSPGEGVKIIWWFVAVLKGDSQGNRGQGEEQFKAEFFKFEKAIEKLHYETDREVLKGAIELVEQIAPTSDQL